MRETIKLPTRVASLLFILLALAGTVAAAETAPTEPPPIPVVTTASGLEIHEVALDNGLRIFVLERPTTPTFAAIYQFGVGGSSDPKGRSGIAHLLEHMMFKGTKSIGITDAGKEAELLGRLDGLWTELETELDKRDDPFRQPDEDKVASLREQIEAVNAEHKKLIVKNEFDELMTRAGGVGLNASTGNDVTRYYIQLPANRLEFWFRMESDRLLHPVFREFYSERDVVLEERRLRYDNTPWGKMYEAMQTLLFVAHPYGTPVIGWPSDLQRLMRRDAMSYFTTYYSPSNCVMALVGDVDTDEVRRLAKKYFGGWKRQQIPRLPITEEPEQTGRRTRIVEFDAEPQIQVSWRTVAEGDPDQYALDTLSMVLGGLYSSRFDETIVQRDRLATNAGTSHPTSRYAGYFSAYGEPRGEHTTDELEQAFDREIKRVQDDGVTAEELERAKTAVEAARVRQLKSNMGQASLIANAVFMSGGVGYMDEYGRRIEAVTPDQVRDVAVRYLKPDRKNVIVLKTVEGTDGGEGAGGAGVSHQRGGAVGQRGAKHSEGFGAAMKMIRDAKPVELRVPELGRDVRRVELEGGMTVFIKEDHSAPSVEMGLVWLGGSNTAPIDGLAPFELASDLLGEGGTEDLTPTELQAEMDALGMSFGVWLGSTTGGGRFWSLSRNFDQSFDLALDVLERPRFDADRLEVLKGQYIERMRRRDESPGRAASILLDHVIFGDHPRLGYVPSRVQIEAITRDSIRQIWQQYLGKNNLYVTVVGDFDTDEMLALLQKKLGGWRDAVQTERRYITHEPFYAPGLYVVEQELPQPAVRLYEQIDVDRDAPMKDHAALEILNDILGGSGFRSRLMERLRSDEGLTYGIYSGISHQGREGVPGALRISYQTRKDSVARSIDSVLEEVHKVIAEKVSEPEVQEQIEAWRNRFVFQYTNDFYTVSRLMYNELDDRPYDFDRIELEAVQRVTVDDVLRAAKKYLTPDKLTVAVYGALTPGDQESLKKQFDVTVLDKSAVFVGGYDAPVESAEPEPAGRR